MFWMGCGRMTSLLKFDVDYFIFGGCNNLAVSYLVFSACVLLFSSANFLKRDSLALGTAIQGFLTSAMAYCFYYSSALLPLLDSGLPLTLPCFCLPSSSWSDGILLSFTLASLDLSSLLFLTIPSSLFILAVFISWINAQVFSSPTTFWFSSFSFRTVALNFSSALFYSLSFMQCLTEMGLNFLGSIWPTENFLASFARMSMQDSSKCCMFCSSGLILGSSLPRMTDLLVRLWGALKLSSRPVARKLSCSMTGLASLLWERRLFLCSQRRSWFLKVLKLELSLRELRSLGNSDEVSLNSVVKKLVSVRLPTFRCFFIDNQCFIIRRIHPNAHPIPHIHPLLLAASPYFAILKKEFKDILEGPNHDSFISITN